MAGTEGAEEAEISFGRWSLSPGRRRLLADGRPVMLGSRTFDVLLALVEARGELVSKDALIRRVWPGTIVDDNSLQVQISALRKALGADAAGLIATVPGRGYCFTGHLRFPGDPASPRSKPAAPPAGTAASVRASLAVLPFRNLSGDPDQEFFSDGIVGDLITALSRVRWFFVVARNSCFTYKNRLVPVQQVGQELGVRYVVQGDVRRSASRVRINVQLVETQAGDTVWADQFNGSLDEVFDLEDRVVARIVGAVDPGIRRAEIERVRQRPTRIASAYEDYLHAISCLYPMTEGNCAAAFRFLDRALESDPGFALARSAAAWCHMWRVSQDTDNDKNPENVQRAIALAEEAVAAAPNDPTVLAQTGIIFGYLSYRRQAALAFVERAVALHPNSALVRSAAGWVQLYEGNGEAAIIHLAEAIRLDPLDPGAGEPITGTCYAHLLAGRLDLAVAWGERAVAASPDRSSASRALVAVLGAAGRPAEAEVARLLALDPGFNLTLYGKLLARHASRPLLGLIRDGMRRAGVPEA